MPQRCACTDSDLCRHPWSDDPPPDGAARPYRVEPGEFRTHHAEPSLHRDEHYEIGGVIRFRQSPPVHIPGAAYDSPIVRTVPREVAERDAAAASLGSLTDKQRETVLARVAGATAAQIARDKGETPEAVRMRLYRARKAIGR
mgnify:CR=1 FL=1